MPVKTKSEGILVNVPGQLPSFQDEKYIEQLLQLIADNDDVSLISLIAIALGADEYLIDLKQQIIVDTRLHFIRFCASQNYTPSKIVHLIKWMINFQDIVENGSSLDEMQNEVINFVSLEIEEGWKWKQAPPVEENAVETPPISKSTNKKNTRVAEKVAAEEMEAAAALPRENIYLTKEEIGPFCIYLLHGIIRHASLYAYVSKFNRDFGVPKEFEFFVEVPTPAPPLRQSLQQEKTLHDTSISALDEIRKQRESELSILVEEYKEAIMKEELWRKTQQTEKEMQFLIENEGTKKAVEDTYGSLELDLAQRQSKILQRIASLEKVLGADNIS